MKRRRGVAAKADAFDRRIVTLLAFGPAATTIALSALTGRGTIAMWGYPLWLFLGVWIVLYARAAITPARLARVVATMGRGVRAVRARLRRQLFGAGDARPALSRGVLSGRSARRRTRAALSCRHRPAARLRDREHVGRRQRRPLRARAAAGADRRRPPPCALDRSRRSAQQGRRGGVDRRRSRRHAGRACAASPATPRCSRRSRCRSGAAITSSPSAGRSCARCPHSRGLDARETLSQSR